MVNFISPVAPLFVPGSRPERFHKADASTADAVILDLEDAVAPADKDRARDAILAHASGLKSLVIVRINAPGTNWNEADLDAVNRLDKVSIMLPKAERSEDIANIAKRTRRHFPVIAQVESAIGLAHLPEILCAENLVMVAFGSLDFSLDLGCAHERLPLLAARSELVWRSRAARRLPPLDGVTTNLENPTVMEDDASHAAELGFGGKLAIHPKQIEPIVKAFRPSEKAIVWARNTLGAASSGEALRIDGEMVDRPVIERARKILSYSEAGRRDG